MRFILGLLLGAALGASVGLLVAPQPGSDTRRALRRVAVGQKRMPGGAEQADEEGL